MTYLARRSPQHESLTLRGLKFHLYRWPGTQPTVTVLLHGFLDSAQTFQFLIDELPASRTVLAPDLRGFGNSQWAPGGYWFADYLADLQALLDHVSPDRPVNLIGHSMGGNIAGLYAGVRPERIARLVLLEGFGMARTQPMQAAARYREWLTELQQTPSYSTYASFEAFAATHMRRNPRVTAQRADFIARSWGIEDGSGSVVLRADPAHKRVNPVLYRRDEAQGCWRAITAPTLLIIGEHSDVGRWLGVDGEDEQLLASFPHSRLMRMPQCGHMMHHEQPQALARVIEDFLAEQPVNAQVND